MRADEIMTRDVIAVRADQTVAEAIEVLADRGFRHLPVLDDDDHVVGILSDRDVRALGVSTALDQRTREKLEARMRAPVARLMSTGVATVRPETEVREIIDTMLEAAVGAVPVVDHDTDTLIGIVSYVDVLRAVRDAAEA